MASLVGTVANWTLLASLIVGVLSTFVIVKASDIKEEHWAEDRRLSNERIAGLNNDAARLTAENLALQKRIQPRRFPSPVELGVLPAVTVPGREQFNIGFIREFAGTPVSIQPVPDFEALTLANDMASALVSFGWKAEIVSEAQTGTPPLFIQEGVEVAFPGTGQYYNAARALGAALSMIGLTGPAVRDFKIHVAGFTTKPDGISSIMKSYPSFDPPKDTVTVLIGMKPFPNDRGQPIIGVITPVIPAPQNAK